MRMWSLAWIAVASLVLATACRSEPEVERSDLAAAAHELLALQNGHAIHADRFPGRDAALVERMAWFRRAVGSCDRVELYRSHGPKRGRFVFQCERGQVEAYISVDDEGRVNKLLSGARGVEPPEQVRVAAERWLESTAGEAEAAGCRIDRVDLGAGTGAKFVLACPGGEKTLVIDLDREGAPRRSFVVDHATDEWRRSGPA